MNVKHLQRYHAKTFKGLEPVLARELETLGATEIKAGNRGVDFSGSLSLLYKSNFCLRTALRILVPLRSFHAKNEQELYRAIGKIDWGEIMDNRKTFAIDTAVFSEVFRNSHFVALKCKDAIVDQFRERTGLRPSVDLDNPDIRINIHCSRDRFLVSLDSSGAPLFKRGYRTQNHTAPLNEVLAAGMILSTGWNGEVPFLDPMCGSGTLAIEAALIAANIPPGVFREGFAFEQWKDFDVELFKRVLENLPEEREIKVPIMARDIDQSSIDMTRKHVRNAGVGKYIKISKKDFMETEEQDDHCLLVINPPYGERIKTEEVAALYGGIGSVLKHSFGGSEAWVFSASQEGLKNIGLKPDKRLTLYNGALECKFQKYTLFRGSLRDFKQQSSE